MAIPARTWRQTRYFVLALTFFMVGCEKSLEDQRSEIKQLIDRGEAVELVEYIKDHEIDISLDMGEGQTILTYAFGAAATGVVSKLVENNLVSHNTGGSIVDFLIEHNKPDIIRMVFEKGLPVEDKSIDLRTNINVRVSIMADSDEMIGVLLENGYFFPDLVSALELGIDSSARKVLVTLIGIPFEEQGKSALEAYLYSRSQGFLYATTHADKETIEIVDITTRKLFYHLLNKQKLFNNKGYCQQVESGNPSAFIIAKYDTRTKCDDFQEILIRVALNANGHKADIIRLLKFRGIDIDKVYGYQGPTGSSSDTEFYRTPLMFAAGIANVDAVRGFSDAGADHTSTNNTGYSAVDIAVKSDGEGHAEFSIERREKVVRILLDAGANVNPEILFGHIANLSYPIVIDLIKNTTEYKPGVPFQLGRYETESALNRFVAQATRFTGDRLEITRAMLDLGEDPNLQLYRSGQSGLLRASVVHAARKRGLNEIVTLLEDSGGRNWEAWTLN